MIFVFVLLVLYFLIRSVLFYKYRIKIDTSIKYFLETSYDFITKLAVSSYKAISSVVNVKKLLTFIIATQVVAFFLSLFYFGFSYPLTDELSQKDIRVLSDVVLIPQRIAFFEDRSAFSFQHIIPDYIIPSTSWSKLCFKNDYLDTGGESVDVNLTLRYTDNTFSKFIFPGKEFKCFDVDMSKYVGSTEIGQNLHANVAPTSSDVLSFKKTDSILFIWPGLLNTELFAVLLFLAITYLITVFEHIVKFYKK